MSSYSDFAGAIFDVDDMLLDNCPQGETMGLHEQSRLAAFRLAGRRLGKANLGRITPEQCKQAFLDAKVHTVHATIWQMLVIVGEVSDREEMDPEHALLKEIVELKEEQHMDILRAKGCEVPGASLFVEVLAENGLVGKLAIASTACRRDIDVFLEMTNLDRFFPGHRIISREDLTHAKPHPEPYNMAFARLGLPEKARASVAAFEDDPRGIMSAKAAGLYTCAITTRHKRKDLAKLAVPPDLIADSYAEFAKLLGLPVKLEI